MISDAYPKKIITIKQPWAWAIIHIGKDIENRKWRTKFRGRVFIHSSLVWDNFGWNWLKANMPNKIPSNHNQMQVFGHAIGVVDVVDCVDKSDSDWFMGPYGIVLKNPEPIKPYKVTGRLSITKADPELIKAYWDGDLTLGGN